MTTTHDGDLTALEASLAATPPAVAPLRAPATAPTVELPATARVAPGTGAAEAAATETGVDPTEAGVGATGADAALVRLDAVADADRRDRHRYDCPSCGAAWLAPVGAPAPSRSSASAFCPDCDFPLFWAAAGAEAKRRSHQAARRRAPGVDGREALAQIDCWNCGEPNQPDPHAACLRCGLELTPPAPPPPPPPPAEVVYVEVPVSQKRWKIATALLGLALAATIADLWWVVLQR